MRARAFSHPRIQPAASPASPRRARLPAQAYPKKLAYQYLDELQREFDTLFGGQQVEQAARPYTFIKFDTFIQKVRRRATMPAQ